MVSIYSNEMFTKSFSIVISVMEFIKVENIKEDSLDSIPSPSHSAKIQIIGGKVYLR